MSKLPLVLKCHSLLFSIFTLSSADSVLFSLFQLNGFFFKKKREITENSIKQNSRNNTNENKTCVKLETSVSYLYFAMLHVACTRDYFTLAYVTRAF